MLNQLLLFPTTLNHAAKKKSDRSKVTELIFCKRQKIIVYVCFCRSSVFMCLPSNVFYTVTLQVHIIKFIVQESSSSTLISFLPNELVLNYLMAIIVATFTFHHPATL